MATTPLLRLSSACNIIITVFVGCCLLTATTRQQSSRTIVVSALSSTTITSFRNTQQHRSSYPSSSSRLYSTPVSPNDPAAAMTEESPPPPPSRILFVGNSLTYVNNVDQWVKNLHDTARPGTRPELEIARCVKGGASLKKLWQKTDAKRSIASGSYDAVVLQEDLPETTVAHFSTFARRFISAARDAGATPLLHRTWAYARLPGVTDGDIGRAHRDVAGETGVGVADVARARLRAAERLEGLDLWAEDREHPSEVGAYLAALVLYRALFREPTVGIALRPEGLAEEDAAVLQGIVDGLDGSEEEGE